MLAKHPCEIIFHAFRLLSSGPSLLMSHCSLPVEAEEEGMEGRKTAGGGQEERTEGKLLDMQNK